MEFNSVRNNVIFIRADGGSNIGFGHIMRMLALAEELKKKYKVYFLCKSNNNYKSGIEKVKHNGFEVINISENNLVKDIISSQKKYKADVLITDSYDVDEAYFDITRKYFNVTGYIDDVNAYKMNVDFVVNQNINAEKIKYNVCRDTELFLGTQFCMMREEFREAYMLKHSSSKVNDVLITVGGMDDSGLSANIVNQLKNLPLRLHVVIGAAFTNDVKAFLKQISLEQDNIVLHENAVMSELMLKCDVAVSACGSTLYELCAMNVPTIGIIIADNQEQAAANMKNAGAVYDIVYKHEISKIALLVSKLSKNDDLRKTIVKNQKDIVNVNGAELLAEDIGKIIESRCNCGKISD